jgi:pSer/pThr/pTyr-binding forkhead associated (FHA) protein
MPRVTIAVPGNIPQPYRFPLDRRVVTLGRGSKNDIVIDCASVSMSHAEMRRVDGGFELRDLDSTNGLKLDDKRLDVVPLRSRMSVKLGDVTFDFLLTDEECGLLGDEKPREETPAEPVPAEESTAKESPEEPAARRGKYAMILWFLLLAVIAFIAGMAIRFQKETGGSWFDAIRARIQSPAAAHGADRIQ